MDGGGNVVVTGSFENAVDFGGGELRSAGDDDDFVAKYSAADGSHKWSKGFGGPSAEHGNAVAVDGSNNVVVTGDAVDVASGGLVGEGFQIFVAKYSAVDGSRLWSREFGGSGEDRGHSVAVDGSDNVVVTGVFIEMVDFGRGCLTTTGGTDIFLLKLRR